MTFLNGSYEYPAGIRVSSLVIYDNDGRGRWSGKPTEYRGEDDITFALGDMNDDGHVDYVVYMERDGENILEVTYGDGRGNWSRERVSRVRSPGTNVTSVLLEDVNLDGMLDIITNNGTAVG